jgi:hypothetical protein
MTKNFSKKHLAPSNPAAAKQSVGTAPGMAKVRAKGPRGLTNHVVWRPVHELRRFPGNPRRHPESKIANLMKHIKRFWTNPILVDEHGTILAGHGRYEAAIRLGMTHVPTINLTGLTDSEKRAVVIADNRLPEKAIWDFDQLRDHFKQLIEVDFEVELTGFSTGEADIAPARTASWKRLGLLTLPVELPAANTLKVVSSQQGPEWLQLAGSGLAALIRPTATIRRSFDSISGR